MLDEIVGQWREVGFTVNDVRKDAEVDKVVGYVVSRSPARLQLPLSKVIDLWEGLAAVLRMLWAPMPLVATLTGIWVWGALLRREVLAIPFLLFKQLEYDEGRVVRLWPGVRAELRAMQRALPLMFLDLGAPMARALFATDARGGDGVDAGGHGTAFSPASADEMRVAWARARTLGHTVARVDGSSTELRRPDRGWKPTLPHTRLPDPLLASERWLPLDAGLWVHRDHINLGEGRTVVRLMRRLAAAPSWRRHVILSLIDNTTAGGAFGKGRSPSGPVNFLCRQFAAAVLAGALRAILPWVQTLKQPADYLSRL